MSADNLTFLLVQHRHDPRRRMAERGEFADVLGVPESSLCCVDVHEQVPDPALADDIDAIIIGGSGYSVFEDVPHFDATVRLITSAASRGVPVLGVCFGAQLLAAAYGGTVVRDPDAKEVGSFLMRRTDDGAIDAVFADLPDRFYAQCAHQDRISMLPPDAIALISSDRCPVQAFTFPGRDIYAVQFHPETTKARFIERITDDTEHLAGVADTVSGADGATAPAATPGVSYSEADPYDIRETPHAAAVVRRFVDRVVVHRARIRPRSGV